jgi:hypothetical protein
MRDRGDEERRTDERRFYTDNMAITAYLHKVRRGEHGIWMRSARRINGPGRFEFVFSDPEGKAAEMAMEFANSESCLFDDGMRSVKNMLSASDRNRNGARGGPRR